MWKLTNYMERIQLTLGAAFLVIFVATTLIQVITRYLGISAIWTEEISVNAFIWSMFLGAAVMTRKKQHFSFNFLNDRISPRNLALLFILQDVIMLAFCIVVFIYSCEITNTFWNSRWITIPSLKQGWVWLILPIMFISMGIYLLEDTINQVYKFKSSVFGETRLRGER